MIYFNIFQYHLVILWLYEPLRAMDCHGGHGAGCGRPLPGDNAS